MKNLLAIFIFTIDLLSKLIISNTLTINKPFCVIKDFFYLTYTNNTGAAFSIMQNNRLLLILISLIILFIIIYYIKENKINNKVDKLSFSMIIGGLVGNLFDRVFYGYVIDFFDFYIFGYEFAIFNIADVAIVIGVFILIINTMRRGLYDNKSRR